jgi:hypothetical protein
VDGRALGEHDEVKRFIGNGFEWAYEGDGPQQLAPAILADHLGDNDKAVRLSGPFMKAMVSAVVILVAFGLITWSGWPIRPDFDRAVILIAVLFAVAM